MKLNKMTYVTAQSLISTRPEVALFSFNKVNRLFEFTLK